jgi:chloramphenicol-sensitive protein RarD
MDQPTRLTDTENGAGTDMTFARNGLLAGITAYAMWGVLPIYFKLLAGVSATAIVAHRIIWSMAALLLLAAVTSGWGAIRAALSDRATVKLLAATSVLIAINWLLYVYAVNSGHILAGSLGYYLNPLANILLGRFVLKEPLSRLQWLALAIAACGVAVLAVGAWSHLWISLTLCVSFATYGLLRKIAKVDSGAGLAIETGMLFPVAVAWLIYASANQPVWGATTSQTVLLVLAGIVSTTPLLLFTAAARRLRYSTLGILQFIAPTMQFLVAVLLYGEPVTLTHKIAFALIWTAATLYLISTWQGARATSLPKEAP